MYLFFFQKISGDAMNPSVLDEAPRDPGARVPHHSYTDKDFEGKNILNISSIFKKLRSQYDRGVHFCTIDSTEQEMKMALHFKPVLMARN